MKVARSLLALISVTALLVQLGSFLSTQAQTFKIGDLAYQPFSTHNPAIWAR